MYVTRFDAETFEFNGIYSDVLLDFIRCINTVQIKRWMYVFESTKTKTFIANPIFSLQCHERG